MAGLLITQQIACTTNIKIVARKRETGTERVQRLQHAQALFRCRCQCPVRRHGEIGIGARLGTPHPPAKLIQLRKAEHIRSVNDKCVCGRNIDAGFNNGGRNQHVILAVIKGCHPVFDLASRHLAMRGNELHLRHIGFQKLLSVGEISDTRYDIEALAAAIMLAQQRLANDNRIEGRNIGAHGKAIDRRRRDQRQLPHPRKRKLERARNRCRREREHMHFCAQFLQLLLVAHTEMLLLIHDHEAEITEFHLLAEKRVRSNDNIHIATRKSFARFGHILRADKTRHLPQFQRQSLKALGKGAVVLTREQCSRYDNRNLIAGHCGDKSRAQRHFRLAESDIATNEPVHRSPAREIFKHGFNCLFLIFRFRKGKARTEFIIGTGRRLHDGAGLELARGSDADKLGRHLADAFLEPRFARLPARPSQPVKLRIAVIRAIARKQFDILNRQIELVATVIDKQQTIMRRAHHFNCLQTLEAADAVIHMNDKIARREAGCFGEEIFGALFTALPNEPVAQNVLLADNGQLIRLETRFKPENNQRNGRFANTVNIGPTIGNENISDTVVCEHMLQPIPRAFAPACNGHALSRATQPGDMTAKNLKNIHAILRALGCKIAPLPATKIEARSFGHTERRKLAHAAGR